MIFDAMMKIALQKVQSGVTVSGQLVNNLRFVDDIDLIAESTQQLQEITTDVNESRKRFGLRLNETKTKIMTIGKKTRGSQHTT